MSSFARSLGYRARWAKLGVLYLTSPKTDRLRVAGRRVQLSVPPAEQAVQLHEFHRIVIEDCYRLSKIGRARTVLDIGANIGLFAIAARHRFPRATIHCYEPNRSLEPYLTH